MLREYLLANSPITAIGYKLYCFELEMWFPIGGRTKRFDGTLKSTDYFSLVPFEAPLVPIGTRYALKWVLMGGVEVAAAEYMDKILVDFPQTIGNRVRSGAAAVLRSQMKRWTSHSLVTEGAARTLENPARESVAALAPSPLPIVELDAREEIVEGEDDEVTGAFHEVWSSWAILIAPAKLEVEAIQAAEPRIRAWLQEGKNPEEIAALCSQLGKSRTISSRQSRK